MKIKMPASLPAENLVSSPNQMPFPASAKINEKNHLVVGGCDVVELANSYGTPLYVLDEQQIRNACREFLNGSKNAYSGTVKFLYASKALNTLTVNKIISEEGFGIDVMSEGELLGALHADIPGETIYFHGNNKSKKELQLALKNHCKIVVDNWHELELLKQLSTDKAPILVRITPAIESATHHHIRTGQRNSKFGFDLDEIDKVFTFIKHSLNIECLGIHVHVGSQVSNMDAYIQLAQVAVKIFAEIKTKCSLNLQELNLGGGLAVNYTGEDYVPSIREWVTTLLTTVADSCRTHNISVPTVIFEPGRSIVATAGLTLYRIGSQKTVPNFIKYISVDGGMSDNPRPITYDARHQIMLGNRAVFSKKEKVTVVGKHCESGDILFKEVEIPTTQAGDILVVSATGAYNYSQSSNYNKIPRPAMVLVSNGHADIIIRRESNEDLFKNDQIPERFKA